MLNISKIINKFVKNANQRELEALNLTVQKINNFEAKIKKISDKEFPQKTKEFKLKIKNDKVAYVTQTTLSTDDTKHIIDCLCNRFPNILSPIKSDICYATQNRQDAVKSILNYCDYLLVIGSVNSSNSRRLVELALKNNIPSKLIDDTDDINLEELKDKRVIGITAGASAPEILLDQVTEFLMKRGAKLSEVKQDAIKENIIFSMPKELRNL